jgi:hypothetical protein
MCSAAEVNRQRESYDRWSAGDRKLPYVGDFGSLSGSFAEEMKYHWKKWRIAREEMDEFELILEIRELGLQLDPDPKRLNKRVVSFAENTNWLYNHV